jgi:hypothetical protein
MKEVLTKRFWQGVKSTFYEALEDRPPENNVPQVPAESSPKATSTPETPVPPSTSSER